MILSSNPPRNLHRDREMEGVKWRIIVAAVDIDLNVGESRDIITFRGTDHHSPASYYSLLTDTTTTHSSLLLSNLPTIKIQAVQMSTITMEKSLWTTVGNPPRAIATQWVRQRTKIPSWRAKAGGKITSVTPNPPDTLTECQIF